MQALQFGLIVAVAWTFSSASGAVLPRNDSCLTPTQEQQLQTAIKDIHTTLGTAVMALNFAAALEKDPHVKQDLETAATVISAVNQDLVGNLSKIANEACGTCSQILKTVDDAIDSIKETLEKIDPNWQSNPIWKAVFTAITAIEQIVGDLCPSVETPLVGLSPRNDSCLTPTQKQQLQTAIKDIHTTLGTAVTALNFAAALEKDPATKKNLETAATVISAINQDLVGNLSKIVNEACGTCSQILKTVDDAIDAIKQTLEQIDPNWQNNPIWKAVFTAITAIEGIVGDLCPSTSRASPRLVPAKFLLAQM